MKLEATWNNEAYDVVMDTLHEAGFVGYAVGGCVRDAIVGEPFNDVDVATNARPHDLPKLFDTIPWDGDSVRREGRNGVVLYPTGVNHGTWTVRVGNDEVEVTTFRKDVATDGRNATVEFANTMEEDAMRRDFTMNALYCDRFNEVHDPTGTGVADLLAGRVRFVGDAAERVQEDYLRILRLFRFQARFGRGPMDTEAFNAASAYRHGLLEHVSGERIWDETKKLLSSHDPFEACLLMETTLVGPDLFEAWDTERLGTCLRSERVANCAPRWSRRFVALGNSTVTFPCSNSDKDSVENLRRAVDGPVVVSQAVMAQEHGDVVAYDWAVLTPEVVRPNNIQITRGAEATFPVSAQDLMDMGYVPGKALGDELRMLKKWWVNHDLEPTKERLLNLSQTMVRK